MTRGNRTGRHARQGVRAASIGVLALLLAFAGATAEARPKRLDADEVKALVEGNTVHGYNPSDDSTFTMFHSSNGQVRAELTNVNGQVSRSDGRWWVNDQGKLCMEWGNFRWVNSCNAVMRDDEAVTFVDDNGHIVSFGEVVAGNPDDL
jgi:hypothetical protein